MYNVLFPQENLAFPNEKKYILFFYLLSLIFSSHDYVLLYKCRKIGIFSKFIVKLKNKNKTSVWKNFYDQNKEYILSFTKIWRKKFAICIWQNTTIIQLYICYIYSKSSIQMYVTYTVNPRYKYTFIINNFS